MAYRRRQGITRASTFKEEIHHPPEDLDHNSNSLSSSTPSSSSLAAQAIRASAAHRDSSHSSAYGTSAFAPGHLRSKSFAGYNDDSSFKGESKSGFWGVLARKAKAILEEDDVDNAKQHETPSPNRFQCMNTSTGSQEPCQSTDNNLRKSGNPPVRKGLDALTSSLNQLGDTFEKAFEEGRTIVETKTADIMQETRKLQIRRKGNTPSENNSWQQPNIQSTEPQMQTIHESQLKASRDVAMATAAKAKLLLRELKTIKADLAFAKERCAQLEEENKIIRENREKGDNRADDDMIRLQLETLLAEKARLAHENSIYARENRFLREIVEYHQLTMQDVVYLDEGMEEVTEVYPIATSPDMVKMLSDSPRSPSSPPSPSALCMSPPAAMEDLPVPIHAKEEKDVKDSDGDPTPPSTVSEEEEGTKRAPSPPSSS